MCNKFVVIDLETTGNLPKKGDRIIQFAAVVVENGVITDQYSTLVNPEQLIPPFIEELTGINDEMVADAPVFSEIAPKVLELLDGAFFVAHNVLFDLSFLQEELVEVGYESFLGPTIDTVELSRFLYPTADSYKLSDLAARQGLSHDRPHQADSDAYVTAELFIMLSNKLESLPLVTIQKLATLSLGLKSDIHFICQKLIEKKEANIEVIPSALTIHRGIALHNSEFSKREANTFENCTFPETEEDKTNLLAQAFNNYEKRSGQFQMMDHVYEAFCQEQHAFIEAGTGVGKSLAYLIPSVIHAKKTNERVVISTFTVQLQEQLLLKDVPLLEKMFSFPIKTALLKGRNHFISLEKFEQALRDEEDNYDFTLTKMQILVWLTETSTGDSDELNLSSGGLLFWNTIKNDEQLFSKTKAWLPYDFYLQARKKAQEADIIITNHSLLLTDLAHDKSIIPDYKYVVLDEAHHFHKVAGKHFGFALDYLSVRILLNQIGSYDQKQLFYQLEQLCQFVKLQPSSHQFEVNQLMSELLFTSEQLFSIIAAIGKEQLKGKLGSSIPKIQRGLKNDPSSRSWKALKVEAERMLFLIRDVNKAINERLTLLHELKQRFDQDQESLLDQVMSKTKELQQLELTLKQLFIASSEDFVHWLEVDYRSLQNSTTIYAEPISVASFLKEHFFSIKQSIIFTSATLTVRNSFQFILNEVGISATEVKLFQIPSPFHYDQQVQLLIPEDLPEINSVSQDEYVASITEHIISIAEATKGRMLILFTSHEMLKRTYNLIKESHLLDDFALIAQGITGGSRARLTRNFQRFDKAILLGTNSFWEGVDLPGEDLTCLIIVRLPFSPPDEPMTEAKSQQIKKLGGNPFSEYALPEAIIRFKQGFGRLIRTNKDRGFIVVLDRRIVSTRYGKAFLESIPTVPIQLLPLSKLVRFIHKWL